jgi:integrase
MSKRKNKLPSYRRHKSSGQAVVTLSDKDIYLGVHGTEDSQAAYRRVIAEWLENKQQPPASSRTGAKPDIESANVHRLFVAYWQFCQAYYVSDGQPTHEIDNMLHAARPLIELFGDARIRDFRPTSLKVVRQQMIDAGLSRKTINNRVNRIRRIFKWGVENDLVEPTVLQALQAIAPLRRGRCGVKEGPGVRPVPDDLIETTLVCMPGMVQAMIRVQLYSGMRPGELVIMRTGDIDTSGKVWVYRPESHKTEHHGHDRVIYLGAKAQDYIKPYLGTDLDAYIFDPRKAMEQRWATCKTHRQHLNVQRKTTRRISDRYTTATYLRAIYYACDKAFPPPEPLCRKAATDGKRETLKAWNERLTKEQHTELKAWQKAHRWHPHQLRHNAATYLRKEFGIEAARVVLGHKSVGVTEIYAELDRMKAAEIMGKVG